MLLESPSVIASAIRIPSTANTKLGSPIPSKKMATFKRFRNEPLTNNHLREYRNSDFGGHAESVACSVWVPLAHKPRLMFVAWAGKTVPLVRPITRSASEVSTSTEIDRASNSTDRTRR